MTSYLKQKQLDIEVEVSIEDAVDEVIYVRSNICASDGVIRIRGFNWIIWEWMDLYGLSLNVANWSSFIY